jgi:hypothetical protein
VGALVVVVVVVVVAALVDALAVAFDVFEVLEGDIDASIDAVDAFEGIVFLPIATPPTIAVPEAVMVADAFVLEEVVDDDEEEVAEDDDVSTLFSVS